MIRPTTNIQCVMNMMQCSAYGAIAQLVIMTAIEKYCLIACEERLPENGMINPDAWQGAAKEIIEKLNIHYRKNNENHDQLSG